MGRHIFLIRTIVFCGACLAVMWQPAQANELTAEQLVNNAHADGGLIATASACHLPKDTINQLIFQQKKLALDTAKAHQLVFTAKDYDEYVVAGFQSTLQYLTQQDTQSDAFDALCSGISEKVDQKLSASPPAQ